MMNSTQTATPIMTQPLTLANLTPKQRAFIEYFYINVYNPIAPQNLWNPSLGSTLFSRSLVKSLCKKFGYGGTIQWIVRKPFGRRGERGLYNIPEIKELHDLWECSVINMTIKTHNGQEFPIKRANNKDFQ